VFDPQFLVEQAPPDHDRLAGEFGIDLIHHPRDRQAAIDTDQATLRLAREDAEPFPGTHLPHTVGRQMCQPVVDARMRLGAMVATVIGGDEARKPAVRLRFGLGFMEMVERLVRILHGAEWPFDLALGAVFVPFNAASSSTSSIAFFYCGEDDIGIDAFLCVQLIYIYIYMAPNQS